ncbi:MAG: double zinc ribbon domain-containing protein [Mariprofundaceae bacterium]|nr:double zinc ribbon domain-containing protein [Mariprofundaceae bacterium]
MRVLSTRAPCWVNQCRRKLFPPGCLFCHQPLQQESHCCRDCLEKIETLGPSYCCICGMAMAESIAPGPCGKCLATPPAQVETVSLFAYRGGVREALLRWKLGSDDAAVHWLLSVAERRLTELFKPEDLLLPVPMPLSRMRKSGQHHAADLCRMIARITGSAWEWRILRRRGVQARQSALSGVARRINLRKSFYVDEDCLQSGRLQKSMAGRLWVVDDIVTTGATLHHAAKALRPLKQPVYAFSLARTLLHKQER